MKASILAKLDSLSERYEEVGALMSDPDIIGDQNKFRELSKEYAELEPVVKCYLSFQEVVSNIDEAKASGQRFRSGYACHGPGRTQRGRSSS